MHLEELRETIQDYLDSLEITRGLEDMLEEDVLELIMRILLGLQMEQEEEIRAIVREELERRKGIIEEEHEEEEESKEEEEEEQKERTCKRLPSP